VPSEYSFTFSFGKATFGQIGLGALPRSKSTAPIEGNEVEITYQFVLSRNPLIS
jgi:hypothetical protein